MSKETEMNEEIQSKITIDMKDEKIHTIYLKYKDIVINLSIIALTESDGLIKINDLDRAGSHHSYRLINEDQQSDKGDGSLFLSLMVIHCNKLFGNIPHPLRWAGILSSDWWWKKGICSIKDACEIQEDGINTFISNEHFLEWATKIVTENKDKDKDRVKSDFQPIKSEKTKKNRKGLSMQERYENARENAEQSYVDSQRTNILSYKNRKGSSMKERYENAKKKAEQQSYGTKKKSKRKPKRKYKKKKYKKGKSKKKKYKKGKSKKKKI